MYLHACFSNNLGVSESYSELVWYCTYKYDQNNTLTMWALCMAPLTIIFCFSQMFDFYITLS
jgi:hypothetical protein